MSFHPFPYSFRIPSYPKPLKSTYTLQEPRIPPFLHIHMHRTSHQYSLTSLFPPLMILFLPIQSFSELPKSKSFKFKYKRYDMISPCRKPRTVIANIASIRPINHNLPVSSYLPTSTRSLSPPPSPPLVTASSPKIALLADPVGADSNIRGLSLSSSYDSEVSDSLW